MKIIIFTVIKIESLMKSYLFSACMLFLVMSCSSDDDTTTTTVPQCPKPTNVSTSAITYDSATISWDDNNASTYTVEFGLSGFSIGSGTSSSTDQNDITFSGLMASTSYDVYIKSNCSSSNTSMYTDVFTFTTAAPLVVPEFMPTLSELNLFSGDLEDLTPSPYALEYELSTPLFTDYAHKQRIIALPEGSTMEYVDDGFPNFPDKTVIAKTFYYFNDERDESLGKKIIETRVLIKVSGEWQLGNYKWNEDQTVAVLDNTTGTVPVSFIDADGDSYDINYIIPSENDCIACHNSYDDITPIGPKLRSMNFNDQLQNFIDAGHLTNLTDPNTVSVLPNWLDESYSLEQRARAYFDVNCAHCHSDGGYCEVQTPLRLPYETTLEDSQIYELKDEIDSRMQTYNPPYTMPLIGTSVVHEKGYSLIRSYLSTLE